jgi:hypothetical protein
MPRSATFALTAVLLVTHAATAGAEALSAEEQELVALVNQVRVDAGLPALQADTGLAAVARAHSLDMATTGFFSHSSPTTGEMGDRLSVAGVDFRAAGENIALNQDVRSAHDALVQSAPHRENILNPEVTHLGVGIVSNGRSLLVTEVFVRPGARFAARIPTIAPMVAEASPEEVRQVSPQVSPQEYAPVQQEQANCDDYGQDDGQQWDADDTEVDVQPFVHQQFVRQQQPMIQVRPMPVRVMPYPPMGRGYWMLGPRGNWVQVRMQPAPARPRIMRRGHRSLF